MPEFDDDGNPIEDPVKQQREHIDELENQLKAARKAEKERDELKAQLDEVRSRERQAQLTAALAEVGGKPGWASFYPPDAEATAEAVKAWATEKELIVTVPAEPEPPAAAWSPTIAGVPSSGGQNLTYDQYVIEVTSGDPLRVGKALELSRAGRVER